MHCKDDGIHEVDDHVEEAERSVGGVSLLGRCAKKEGKDDGY